MLFATLAMSYMQLSSGHIVVPEFLEANLNVAMSPDQKAMASCAMAHCAGQGMRCQFDKTCRAVGECTKKCPKGDLKCQMHCTDLYIPDDKAGAKLADVVECMVKYECLPQSQMECPVPKNVMTDFDVKMANGKWFVIKGYSDLTDCHDCQRSTLTVTGDKVHDHIQYAVKKNLATTYPHVDYVKRELSIDMKAADAETQGHLSGSMMKMRMDWSYNWYVIAAKADRYMLVWYCADSKMLKGASGAVLYSRESSYDKLTDDEKSAIAAAAEAAKIPGFKVEFMCTIEQRGCPSMDESL